MTKRSILKVSTFLMLILSISLIFVSCGKVEFKIDFIVDDAVYATINTKGEEVLKMPNDPEKDGYTFDGWYWNDGSWEKPFTANSLLDAPLSSNMSVYAKFVKNTINGVSFENIETTYDGTEKEISVENLPVGATVSYDKPNVYTDAGEYTVTATISQANHFDLVLTATLKINKAVYDMSNVAFENKTVTYTGEKQSVYASNLPNGVTVSYENNERVNAGSYIVIAKFTGDNKNFETIPDKSVTLTIEKASVKKPVTDTAIFVYNGKEQTYHVDINSLYSVKGNKQTNAGNYTVEISLKDKANYQWTDKTTDNLFYGFCIQKAVYDMSGVIFESKTVTYDSKIHSIYATNLPKGVTVSYENNENINTGSYIVIAKFTGDNKNFERIPDKTATLTILPDSFKGLAFESKVFIYDGTEKKIEVTGIPTDATVTYDKSNSQINAGKYTVKATVTKENYSDIVLIATLTINKATYNISGVKFDNKTVVYSGEKYSILAQNIPDGLSVSYVGNDMINAGTYNVTAVFTDTTGNYENPQNKTATLTINKANVVGISFTDKTVVYDGNSHNIAISGKLPSGVSVSYENNDKINVGTYTVTANFNDNSGNFIVPANMTAKLIIEKATVSGITFDNKTFAYNGEKRNIEIGGILPEDIIVSYLNNGKINAGTYTVIATFSCKTDNYFIPDDMSATLTIKKAVYDMSGVSFDNKTVTYDGKAHSLTISGILPDGVAVTYANNDKVNANQYVVTASFTGDSINYFAIDDMQAMLIINKATYDMSAVSFTDGEFIYDGTQKAVYITGKLPDGVMVNYNNNYKIFANTYTVTAVFTGDAVNYNKIPDLSASLIINKATYDMSGISFTDESFKYDGDAHSIYIRGNLPADVSVSYKNNGQTEKGEWVVIAQFIGDENYNKIADIRATLTITREEHTLTFKQDGQPDKICKVLDLADFTDIPSVAYVKGYKVVWEEKNYKRITADMEINAIIALETYTITYHLFGGENALKNPDVYTVLDDIELKPAEKTGYTFKGWYSDSSFNDKIKKLSDIATNLDLYARFAPNTYTATFKHDVVLTLVAKGKSVDYIMKSGQSIDLYSTTIMSNFLSDSYNGTEKDPGFLGWYYDSKFKNKVTDEITIKNNTTLYGQFGKENDEAFRVYESGEWVSYNYIAPTLYDGKVKIKAHINSSSFRGIFVAVDHYTENGKEETIYERRIKSYEHEAEIYVSPGERYKFLVAAISQSAFATESAALSLSFQGDRLTQNITADCVKQLTYNYDEHIYVVSPANKPNGYTFSHWVNVNGAKMSDVWNYVSAQVFTPVWTINNYKINYSLDGGVNSGDNPDSYTINDTITFFQASKIGYTFNGWYTDAGYTDKVTFITRRTGNITLYASFTKNNYNLQFDGNGGKWGNTVTFIDGNEIIKTSYLMDDVVCNFYPEAKSGKIFGGWYSDKELLHPYNFNGTITDDLVLYAKWYDLADGDNNCIDVAQSPELSISIQGKTEQRFYFSLVADGKLTVTSVSELDLCGALYDGNGNLLVDSDDISDTDLDFSFTYSVKAGKLYYIVINANTVSSAGDAKIKFDWSGNAGIKGTTYTDRLISVPYGQEIILPATPVKEGFVFAGWFTDNELTSEYNFTTMPASDVTLYAKWIEE